MTIFGPHELLERLGEGAMGVVWRARNTTTGETVALKVLNEGSGGRRFRREFRAARRLDHRNVVRVFEMGHDLLEGRERPWFTMELIVGGTLRDQIDRESAGWPPERNSPAWLAARVSVLHQAALGLEQCHSQGVLHRDLKPTNVLVNEQGVVKLVDFGLARMDNQASSLSGAGQLIGTVAYMSPEQARGGPLDARSDIHGLGAILHELACGEPAFDGEDLPTLLMQVLFEPAPDARESNPGLDPALAELASRCLSKDPMLRPRSAAEVARELESLAESRGIPLDRASEFATAERVATLAPQVVGREAEHALLRTALEEARSRPVLVTIRGGSGLGKSRLAADLRVDAELRGFRVLASAATPSSRPLGALREALAVACRHDAEAPGHDVSLLVGQFPDLLPRGSGRAEDEGESAAPTDRLQLTWAAQAVLEKELTAGPRVLLLDDLQWVDALSAQVIEQLLERDEGALLLVAILRDDETETSPAAEHLRAAFAARAEVRQLTLAPLDEEQVSRVVESMLGKPPEPRAAAEIHRATGGVPHDIEQVVRELAARKAVVIGEDAVRLTLPADAKLAELSATIAMRSRLDALGDEARRVVLTVLLAGSGIHVTALSEALELSEDELLDELEALVRQGLLRDGPGSDVVSLAHDRLRQALSPNSSVDELGALRGSLARALERRANSPAALHRVAELDLATGAFADATRTVPLSAEAFASVGLHAAALQRYEALLAMAVQADSPALSEVRKRRADLLAQAGRTEDSVEAYGELALDPGASEVFPPWAALRLQAFSLMLLGRNEEAAEALERALPLAQAAGDTSGWIRAASVLGTVLDRLGLLERSREHHEQAVARARDAGGDIDLAMALTNLAVYAYRHGALAEAAAAYGEAAPTFERAGDRAHAANCQSGLAAVLLVRGEPASCRPIAREALASMRRAVDVRGLSRVLEVLGLASLQLGDVEEAESCHAEALAIRVRLREPWAQGESSLCLAELAQHCCQWDRAEGLLTEAQRLFELAGDEARQALVAVRRGELAWRARRPGARERLELALVDATRVEAGPAIAEAQLGLARLDADEARLAEARERIRQALVEAGTVESQESTFRLESELLAVRAKTADDIDGLSEEAERVAARAARRPVMERLLDWLAAAAALRAADHPERAESCLSDAGRLLVQLRDKLPAAERELFENQHALTRLQLLAGEPAPEAELSGTEQTELAQLRSFHSLVMASDPTEPDSLMAAFVVDALAQLGFARGFVLVGERGELSCRVALDASGEEIPGAERRLPDQLLRHALERNEPVLSVGVRDDPDLDFEGSVVDLKVEAFAAVPLSSSEGLSAVAYFDGPPPGRDVRESLRQLAPVFQDFGRLLERAHRVKERAQRADALLSSLGGGAGPIVGTSRPVEDLRRLIQTIAPTDASILVLGENGTGKELVARELHARSNRSDGPLLSRSCAELTETLLESELFGHEKGAFTGATRDRAGLFEAASGGTLFLDEVGEMTTSLQAKLLRVLETGEVTRIGSTSSRVVDVRVVAATHRDLAAEVQAGTFRQDLYYRLKVIELRVPALRERRDDLPILAHHFLALSSASRESAPRAFTHDALRALTQHDWPGNVRELRNVIERAVILSAGREEIACDLLPPEVLGLDEPTRDGDAPRVSGTDLRTARETFEKACLQRALEENGGNRTHAARALGISVRSLQQKLNRHELS